MKKPQLLWEFIEQLAEMTRFLHNKKIVHGDVKPANILVTRRNWDFVFKLCDFGSVSSHFLALEEA